MNNPSIIILDGKVCRSYVFVYGCGNSDMTNTIIKQYASTLFFVTRSGYQKKG